MDKFSRQNVEMFDYWKTRICTFIFGQHDELDDGSSPKSERLEY